MATMRSSVLGLLEYIRTTPDVSKSQAQAYLEQQIGDGLYPYLDWSITAWYKGGVLTAETFNSLRNRVQGMPEDQYVPACRRMADSAAMLIEKKMAKNQKQAELEALQTQEQGYQPKISPDQDTLDHWNQTSMGALEHHLALLNIERLEAELLELEDE